MPSFRVSRRTAIMALTTVFVAVVGFAVPVWATPKLTAQALPSIGKTIQAAKAPSARLARSDRSLLAKHGNRLLPVMVRFDVDPVASYAGGISGLRATSPSVTGRGLLGATDRVDAYQRYLGDRMRGIAEAIRAEVQGAQILRTYRIAYGGASMLVPAGSIPALLRVPGVVAVQRDLRDKPLSITTPHFLGADQVWPSLGGSRKAGKNVIVGVLDTGIWPGHRSFRDTGLGATPRAFGCEFGDGSDPLFGKQFACNNKLIGAYAFADTYMLIVGAQPGEFCNNATLKCSARDSDGHGTHTSSTVVGAPTHASIFGFGRGTVSGMAPGARVIMYRVCLRLGCYSSDSVAAIEQAITDGVDVINFSVGGGGDPYSDPVELAFLDAYAAGISVNASAGNSGPGPATADHAGPWVTTVGASYGPQAYATTLRLHAGSASRTLPGATITRGVDGKMVVNAEDVAGYGDPFCAVPMDPRMATDMVVVCRRGVSGRNVKSLNISAGGAAGMILYNPTHQDLFTDNFWIPTVMLDGPSAANSLLAFLDANPTVRAGWGTGTPQPAHADQMTTFSSRGPAGGFIKPDVTAPGLQVLAGNTPRPVDPAAGPPGQYFQAIAGTSMSSPYAAGVAALVKAAHPHWTAGQIKSALMTSSLQTATKEDGVTPADPFDDGAGSIRANRAVKPTLTFDVAPSEYIDAGIDPNTWVDLNLPSIDATVIPGEISTTRYGLNVSGAFQRFSTSTTAPAGATIDVTSPAWGVPSGGTLQIDVTISGAELTSGQYFGSITLHPASGDYDVFIPVAWIEAKGKGLVPPTIDSIDPGGPPYGYVPLSGSFAPLGDVGDETITNLGVSSFEYGGETYDTVGMVSDGYAVIGGGDSTDISFIPPDLPDPRRPNNVIAPFWTDLDPDLGGHMFAGEFSDGVDSWVIMEWSSVSFYDEVGTVSFQIWIQEGPTESVTFVYGADVPGFGDSGSGLQVGAENRDGSSAAGLESIPGSDTGWSVFTSPPSADGSVAINYEALGIALPPVARMTSNIAVGTTVPKVGGRRLLTSRLGSVRSDGFARRSFIPRR